MPKSKKTQTVKKPGRRATASLVASHSIRRAEREQTSRFSVVAPGGAFVALPAELQERPDDSPALKRARRAFLATLPPFARESADRLITDPAAFNAYRPAPALVQAGRDFDAAALRCLVACVRLTRVGVRASVSTLGAACQDAGFDLREAYSDLLRARAVDAPAPVKLTPKGEAARLKSKPPREATADEIKRFGRAPVRP